MVINTFPQHMTIINNIYLHFQPLEGLLGAMDTGDGQLP